MDRDEAMARMRAGLEARSTRRWSVSGGRGTAWGWITITAWGAAKRSMTPEEVDALSALLGERVHFQGASIPSSTDYRLEYVARCEGREPEVIGRPYWD